ncbi:MAG: class I SAM-dependent methyltransferase [Alphaproteobacteria bacterium]|nr:class I SAM-dependent methyltransferase [Alphaproteobacteria bacterium]
MHPERLDRPKPKSMRQEGRHGVSAHLNHDEYAWFDFLMTSGFHIAQALHPGNRQVYDRRVEPAFVRSHGRKPANRREVRHAMHRDPYWQMWSALKLTNRDMGYAVRTRLIEREHADIARRARANGRTKGSLTLDPSLVVPRYITAVDIHGQPGGYDESGTRGGVYAGALYDTASLFLATGGEMGALNDGCGWSIVAYMKEHFPALKPKRILDLGCTVGHSTLPLKQAWRATEVQAIDVCAPVLRFGHARAESLGVEIHFSQQDAAATNFPDAHFDLVTSSMLLHEVPQPAMKTIAQEIDRVLKPGGIMIHAEQPQYHGQSSFDQFIREWDTFYNYEPFRCAFRDMDLVKLATDAGFPAKGVFRKMAPGALGDSNRIELRGPNAWFMFGARKAA